MSTRPSENAIGFDRLMPDKEKAINSGNGASQGLLQILALKEKMDQDQDDGDQLLDTMKQLESVLALLEEVKKNPDGVAATITIQSIGKQTLRLATKIDKGMEVAGEHLARNEREYASLKQMVGSSASADPTPEPQQPAGSGFANGSLAEAYSLLRKLQNTYTELMKKYSEIAQKETTILTKMTSANADCAQKVGEMEANKGITDAALAGASALTSGVQLGMNSRSMTALQNKTSGLETQKTNLEGYQAKFDAPQQRSVLAAAIPPVAPVAAAPAGAAAAAVAPVAPAAAAAPVPGALAAPAAAVAAPVAAAPAGAAAAPAPAAADAEVSRRLADAGYTDANAQTRIKQRMNEFTSGTFRADGLGNNYNANMVQKADGSLVDVNKAALDTMTAEQRTTARTFLDQQHNSKVKEINTAYEHHSSETQMRRLKFDIGSSAQSGAGAGIKAYWDTERSHLDAAGKLGATSQDQNSKSVDTNTKTAQEMAQEGYKVIEQTVAALQSSGRSK